MLCDRARANKMMLVLFTDQQIAFTLQRIFLETFRNFSKTLLSDCDYDPNSGDLPLFVSFCKIVNIFYYIVLFTLIFFHLSCIFYYSV